MIGQKSGVEVSFIMIIEFFYQKRASLTANHTKQCTVSILILDNNDTRAPDCSVFKWYLMHMTKEDRFTPYHPIPRVYFRNLLISVQFLPIL